LKKLLSLNLLLFVLMALAWLLQINLVYPFEQLIFNPELVKVASVIFIPAGFKVLFGTILGLRSLPAVFLATLFGMWLHTDALEFSAKFAFVSTVALYIPVLLVNFLDRDSGDVEFVGEQLVNRNPLTLFRKAVVIAVLASLLNSFFSVLVYGPASHPNAWMHFLIGDVVGTIVVVAIIVGVRAKLYRLLLTLVAKERLKDR
jgi:integral membrane sensor domain MASE1